MNYVGIDLHKTSSQVCILTVDGELIERRIKTDKRDARARPCTKIQNRRLILSLAVAS